MNLRGILSTTLLWSAFQAQGASVSLDFGAGYSRSSAPAMATRSSDPSVPEQKTVGEEFSGYHLFLTLGIPVHRWFALQASISGAFQSGEVHHPGTLWAGTPLTIVPGILEEGDRRTFSYLAGIRVQDRESVWRVSPWAFALAGFATQSTEPATDDSMADPLFYSDVAVAQKGFALALGLGVDAKMVGRWGLRLGVEYHPIFLGDEEVLAEGEGRTILGREVTSMQSVRFVGETMHDVRVVVGPMFGF